MDEIKLTSIRFSRLDRERIATIRKHYGFKDDATAIRYALRDEVEWIAKEESKRLRKKISEGA